MKQAYANHRSSGIEWLGDVPAHWGLQRLGFALADAVAGGTPSTSRDDYWAEDDEDGMPWIAIADMSDGGIVESTEKAVTEPGMRDARLRPLPPGTIIYSMYASVGAVAVLGLEAVTNQAILSLLPRRHVENPFLFWWLHALRGPVLALTRNNTQANLNAETVRRFPIVLPPASEQQAISAFLDSETSRIDRLITMQESLIERLDEYRTALITRVVTKGLPPEAAAAAGLDAEPALKDSGVEWLGEVPEHWDVVVLKRIASINDEALSDDEDPTRLMEYVDIGSVRYGEGVVERTSLVFEDAPSRARRLVQDGDTIISTVRTYLRAIAQLIDPPPSMVVSTGFAVVRPRSIEPRFAYWAMSEAGFVGEIVARSVGVSYPAINALQIGLLAIAVPPSEEQQAIAAYLDEQSSRIDILRVKAELSIERLLEYRSALVSAAVTGKIDVRDTALVGDGV